LLLPPLLPSASSLWAFAVESGVATAASNELWRATGGFAAGTSTAGVSASERRPTPAHLLSAAIDGGGDADGAADAPVAAPSCSALVEAADALEFGAARLLIRVIALPMWWRIWGW
jgi:hypothetical protein